MSKSQRGFSTTWLVVIVVAVGILGLVGWLVWQSNQPAVSPDSGANVEAPLTETEKELLPLIRSSLSERKLADPKADIKIRVIGSTVKDGPAEGPLVYSDHRVDAYFNKEPGLYAFYQIAVLTGPNRVTDVISLTDCRFTKVKDETAAAKAIEDKFGDKVKRVNLANFKYLSGACTWVVDFEGGGNYWVTDTETTFSSQARTEDWFKPEAVSQ